MNARREFTWLAYLRGDSGPGRGIGLDAGSERHGEEKRKAILSAS